ncbi:MAG TPA: hypothetical protein VF970_11380 [Gemmatimonadales bacterium]
MNTRQPARYRWPVVALAGLAAAACATGGATGAGAPGRGSNVITAEMLADQPVNSAYEAVQRLRPRWLIERGPTTLAATGNPVVVYVDNQRMGGVEELRTIAVHTVEEIRFRDASDATTRYGTGHTSGAIEVTTRRR